MRIAIHHYKGDFSDRWIEYCQKNQIEYQLVDCYQNDIIEVMRDFDILLWSWNLSHFESLQFARELIFSLETMGKIVFPNFKTSYFYDNKVGQKYLLESIDAPCIPSYVFYTKKDALEWIDKTSFPKVFKLSGGAGSMNVKLCHTKKEAEKFVNIAFGKGFPLVDRKTLLKDKFIKFKEKPSSTTTLNLLKAMVRIFVPTKKEKYLTNAKGYIYFQDFVPQNNFDIRIITIGDKAIGMKRLCRDGDFRASGSGKIVYDKNQIPEECIKISFDISKKLSFQCMAYDYIFDENNKPLVVEMSYHFAPYVYDDCQGYWNENLDWFDAKINPQNMIIEFLTK